MKKNCNDCMHLKNGVCVKNLKNGYFNCSKYKAIPIADLTKEYKSLLVSGDNPERQQFLKEKLEGINGGVV